MNACLLDMLHDAANQHHFAIADGIDIHFNRIVEEAIQQHRRVVGDADRGLEVAAQILLVIDDLHRPAAEHIRRTHHQRVANLFRFLYRLLNGGDGGVRRLLQLQTVNRVLEALTVFRPVDSVRTGTDNRHAGSFQGTSQLQRGLAAVLDDNAFWLLDAHDFQHVFQGYRLKIQTVGGVVVGRDGFRVTVDHDGLVTVLAQRQRGVYAAVVEFDTLPDTVRAAAEDHDFIAVNGRVGLTLFFISGVHVGGIGSKFRSAGVHALVDRVQVILVAQLADFRFPHARQLRQTRIGKAFTLQGAQEVSVEAVDAHFRHFLFQTDQLFNLYQEPAVDVGQVEDAVNREARAERVSDIPDTLSAGIFQLAADFGQRFRVVEAHFRVKAGSAHFQTAQRFLQRFLLGTANRHHFADRLHLGGQTVVGAGEFFEVKAWDFSDHVVDGRFKGSRGAAAGDVVHQLVKGITYRQLGCHFSNREAGGLRGQRRGAGDARVHFDNDQATVFRVDRELHVRAAGFDADFTQHRHRGVTHDLVLFVGQGLRRGNGDGVTGVDPHGVEVFDGADDDAVIVLIAHHFHLVLFPADQRFIDQQFVGRREIQAAFADFFELFAVIGDTAAGAAHGEGRTDDARETNVGGNRQRLFHRVGDTRARGVEADFFHCDIETATVFGFINRIGGGANHGHAEFSQDPLTLQLERAVQRRLAAHGRQHRIRALFFDDFTHHFPVNRLDVGGIGHFRVGHDGRRVRVHQDNAVALFAQRFTGLGAGVVKLTRLTDNNRARAQNQDTFYVCTFWHCSFTPDYFAD